MKSVFLCVGGLLLASLGVPAAASDYSPPPGAVTDPEEILVLPPVFVKGRFPAKGWVYARAGRTEIFSQFSAKETRILLDDFLIFRDFVQAHFPEASLPADLTVTVVLCDRTKSYRMFGGAADRTSSTLFGSSRFILIDGAEARRPEQSMRRRYFDLAFGRHPADRYPLWRELGTREILARLRIGKDRLEIGPLYSAAFGRGPSLDLAELLSFTRPSLEIAKRNGLMNGAATHQSTMFMHMCLFGSTRPFRDLREPYQTFVRRLEKEPFSEELFRECFGRDFTEMNGLLRAYIIGGANVKFESQYYRYTPSAPFEVHPAPAADVERVLIEARALSKIGGE
jgi:hypothetical protein